MRVEVIKTEAAYDVAMERLRALMRSAPAPGTVAANELELLALVIEDFERHVVPPPQPTPLDAILFYMDQMGLTRKDMEAYLGSPSKVSEVLAGKRSLSLTMIRKLHEGLGIPADILLKRSTKKTRAA